MAIKTAPIEEVLNCSLAVPWIKDAEDKGLLLDSKIDVPLEINVDPLKPNYRKKVFYSALNFLP